MFADVPLYVKENAELPVPEAMEQRFSNVPAISIIVETVRV
jgi:hypothetical protein